MKEEGEDQEAAVQMSSADIPPYKARLNLSGGVLDDAFQGSIPE